MNKTQMNTIHNEANKTKMCIMGKIQADKSRRMKLMKEPPELTNWQMYKMIKAGKATLKPILMRDCPHYNFHIHNLYDFPEDPRYIMYKVGMELLINEIELREQAVELAFRRLESEATLEVINVKQFLDALDDMARQEW